jgi:hypothetical protein
MTLPVLASLLLSLAVVPVTAGAQVKDLESRPGTTQRILYIKHASPIASVLLVPGGHGKLNVSPTGTIGWGENNFLVRTRQLWADQGFTVAVLDAPSDRLSGEGFVGFRQNPDHAKDLAAIVAFLRQEANVPVWLVATSRGTTSAAYAGIALKDKGPNGIVVTSSLTNSGGNLPGMKLEQITVPVLVVHHESDQCKHTPYAEVPQIMAKLTGSRKAELITFKDGSGMKGDPCEAISYHGFVGIEPKVIGEVATWIKAQK